MQNNELIKLQQDFNDEVWNAFHGAEINDHDDFYEYMHAYIDNAVIYNYDCDAILEGNSEYHYEYHGVYGRPNNIHQAAYACLYDYLTENDDTVVWSQLEEVLNEANE